MKKLHTYLTIPWIILLTSIPPIKAVISMPRNDLWFMLILIAGFFGLYTLFIKTDWKIKVAAIGSFILCFFGSSFAISFSSYVSVVLCCYFYINCLKIEDWKTIFQVLQTVVFLNVLLMIFQYFGNDTLLNWSLGKDVTCFGDVGYHMQMGCFSVVLGAVLLPFSLVNLVFPFMTAIFCKSSWTFLCAGLGGLLLLYPRHKERTAVLFVVVMLIFSLWAIDEGKFVSNLADNGRIVTWEKSWTLAMKRPWTGWGPGSYKVVFPPLDHDLHEDKPYATAHNWFIELIFETGILFSIFIVWWVSNLSWRLWRAKELICLTGLAMICFDGLVHFPDRMAQCVPLIIVFLAYCEVSLSVVKKP